MKNSLLVYSGILMICFAGCYIGGFVGGIIFGLGAAISLLATVGFWQYKKAIARQERVMNAILKTKLSTNG